MVFNLNYSREILNLWRIRVEESLAKAQSLLRFARVDKVKNVLVSNLSILGVENVELLDNAVVEGVELTIILLVFG